jgi:ankyrin repeat protein
LLCACACTAGFGREFSLDDCDAAIRTVRDEIARAAGEEKKKVLGGYLAVLERARDTKDVKGTLLLFHASACDHADTVRWLIREGADVNAKDSDGTTPLIGAVLMGSAESVRLLVAAGADVNARTGDNASTLLMIAPRSQKCMEIARLLIAAGADVNAKNDKGSTALSFAALAGNAEYVKFLLASKADVSVINKGGATALDAAVVTGHADIV